MIKFPACLLVLTLAMIFLSSTNQRKLVKKYTDAVIIRTELFALTTYGSIDIYNTDTYQIIDTGIKANKPILNLSVDGKEQLVAIEGRNAEIFLQSNLTFKPFQITNSDLYSIVYNAKNEPFLITTNGIYDVSGQKNYIPDSSFRLNKYVRQWGKPSAVYMAPDGCIWLGYAHGEWGGELVAFDTNKKLFVKINTGKFKIELNPLKSFFYAEGKVYFSCGLNHFFSSGCIVRVTNFKCTKLFESDFYKKNDSTVIDGKYIGPAAYDNKDAYIYFYCQEGLFAGNIKKNLSDSSAWKKVAIAKLRWRFGQPDAAGYSMNILKMQFASNGKLFLVTQNDGIGVFDGNSIQLLN